MKMENSGVLVRVILRCTGNRLADFHVPCLSDVPSIGDKVGLADMIEFDSFSVTIVNREVFYLKNESGICKVSSIHLTVVFSFEKWLYRWQEIVDAYQNMSDKGKAFRKSNKFLDLHADLNTVDFLAEHHDAFDIDCFGASLLSHYAMEKRREEHQAVLDEKIRE